MLIYFVTRLDLFDGEGSAGSGEGSGETGANVIYGAQPESAPEEVSNDGKADDAGQKSLEERTKAYKDLINGEYKDIHTSETQKMFDRRFKDYKTLEKTNSDQKAVLDRLMTKYKIDNGDLNALSDAIDNDDTMWEEEADEAGMSIDQYKQFQKLNRENARLLEAERQRVQQQQADAKVAEWTQQANELKAQYPGFDMNAELLNPNFGRLLQSGVPVADAYKVIHFDEITNNAMSAIAKDTEKKVTANVRAKGSRPVENGTTSQSGFTYKNDVSKLTKADRAEIARRAARGDHITFG